MGIEFIRTLRDAGFKVLSNLVSYKLWIFAAATWLIARGDLSEWFWFALAVLIISTRAFEKLLGLGFWGRTSTGHSRPAITGTDQGAGEES